MNKELLSLIPGLERENVLRIQAEMNRNNITKLDGVSETILEILAEQLRKYNSLDNLLNELDDTIIENNQLAVDVQDLTYKLSEYECEIKNMKQENNEAKKIIKNFEDIKQDLSIEKGILKDQLYTMQLKMEETLELIAENIGALCDYFEVSKNENVNLRKNILPKNIAINLRNLKEKINNFS
ncbi:MAG: hypothetical protein ACOC2U_03325 [bacterium]